MPMASLWSHKWDLLATCVLYGVAAFISSTAFAVPRIAYIIYGCGLLATLGVSLVRQFHLQMIEVVLACVIALLAFVGNFTFVAPVAEWLVIAALVWLVLRMSYGSAESLGLTRT